VGDSKSLPPNKTSRYKKRAFYQLEFTPLCHEKGTSQIHFFIADYRHGLLMKIDKLTIIENNCDKV